MIRLLLTKYWVLAHLMVTAGILCFVPNLPVGFGLWAAAALLMMAWMLPPVLRGESFWMARSRAGRVLRADVVLWSGLLAAAYLGVQLANGPRELVYEPELRRWLFTDAPMQFLPSSVHPGSGAGVLVGLLAGVVSATVIRTVLPRKQRLHLLLGLALSAGFCGAVAAAWAAITGAVPVFEALGGTFDASVLWLLMFCVSLGIVGETFLEGHRKTLGVALGAAFLCLFSIFAFAPIEVLGVTLFLAVVYLVFAGVAVQRSGRYPRILWTLALMLPVIFAMAAGLAATPGHVSPWAQFNPDSWKPVMEAFSDQWGFRNGLAFKVFAVEPMLGAGPDGFAEMARFFLKGKGAWALWRAGGTAIPCDFVRLLTECGMVGTLLLLIPGTAMVLRCLMHWAEFRQNSRKLYSFRYIFVFSGTLAGVICVLLASLVGTPLHTPAVLCAFMTVCATMSGWMPRPR